MNIFNTNTVPQLTVRYHIMTGFIVDTEFERKFKDCLHIALR